MNDLIANISATQITATTNLLNDGATVPFIARYRKEATGGLNEVEITAIRDWLAHTKELDKRREAILKSIGEQDKLSNELKKQLNEASTLSQLEDIYLPYKPKRKTRASVAREKGLEPLALQLLAQTHIDVEAAAKKFVNAEKGIADVAASLAGARDIIAEIISEDTEGRDKMRRYFMQKSALSSAVAKGKETEAIKYKDYFEWTEVAKNAPSHRLLAMLRGEAEGLLKLDILPPEEDALSILNKRFIKSRGAASQQVELAITDGYKRLLRPAMETELRTALKQKADEEAIKVFAQNARQLLMAAPLGQKNVLAIDPGFRTGCKVVCLNKQGNLLQNTTIYPHTGAGNTKEASAKITALCQQFKIEAIAIGNGTAGRETEAFIRSLNIDGVTLVMVNESGASIYSASPLAREEFPDHDVTVRGAVSIGRRLMDPLAELVKIDPKSIGVGQYQHDVDQNKLQTSLDDTVASCVNAVGVELNTASKQLLSHVSGLGSALAQNIIDYRTKNGAFDNRESLKKVPRLGEKAFEQAAGFLRIRHAKQPLDASGVHPERYALVNQMAKDLQCTVNDLMSNNHLQQQLDLQRYVSTEVGLPTLQDIVKELAKPGRDPREQFEAFSFAAGVNAIGDLQTGMELKGVVTNITNFGAFVDIGVHQDGLVHTSQLANRFVANPHDVVKVGEVVKVTVVDVDIARKRISLSMKDAPAKRNETPAPKTAKRVSGQPPVPTKKHSERDNLQEKLANLKNKFTKG